MKHVKNERKTSMAKQKKQNDYTKNIKINEEELSITKIGEMTTAEQSPFLVIGIFITLLVFIFFLPSLVNLIKGDTTKTEVSTPSQKEPGSENPPEEKEETYYEISDSLKITLEETLLVNNFKIENQEIGFTLTNNGETRFNFNRKNYFLEMYTEDNTFLERIILKKDSIPKGESVTFHYPILETTHTNVKKIRLVEKEIADYPNIELEKNEAGEEVLVCTTNTETITYKFQNQNLRTITDVINYPYSEDENYKTKLEEWKIKVAKYNATAGITSMFVDTGVGFVVNTTLDLPNVKIADTENENYYAYETKAKIVKFEMDARGFTCK